MKREGERNCNTRRRGTSCWDRHIQNQFMDHLLISLCVCTLAMCVCVCAHCFSCLGCLKPDCDSNAANAASFSLIPANINICPANAHTHRHTCKASQRAGPYFEAELSATALHASASASASAYPASVSALPACAVTHTHSLTCQQLTHKHTHTAELHSPHQAPLALSAHLPFDSPFSPPSFAALLYSSRAAHYFLLIFLLFCVAHSLPLSLPLPPAACCCCCCLCFAVLSLLAFFFFSIAARVAVAVDAASAGAAVAAASRTYTTHTFLST